MSASRASALLRRPDGSARPADPRTTRARTILCAIALGLAPVLLALASLIELNTSDNATRAAEQIAGSRGQFLTGNLFFLLGAGALVPGAIALASLVRGRGAAWMTTGACMMALGGGSLAVGIWSYTAVGFLGTDSDVPRSAVVALLHKGNNSPVTGVPWVIGMGALIGMIVCAVGLIRARAVPMWQPIVLIIAPVLIFFGQGGVVAAILALPLVVVLIALAGEVIRVQRGGDAPAAIDLSGAEMPAPRAGSENGAQAADRSRTTLS